MTGEEQQHVRTRTPQSPPGPEASSPSGWWSLVREVGGAFLLGAFLVIALYQVPARHVVNIGGYDAAYVQGFHDPQDTALSHGANPDLEGSDGSARWSRATSFLVFPQAGLPARVTVRLRGWRASREHPPPVVTVWLKGSNRSDLLGTIQTSGAWEEHRFPITAGLLKANDVVIELHSTTATLPGEDRTVGVLLDRAIYEVVAEPGKPIIPYPAQVAYGAIACGLWWLITMPGNGSGHHAPVPAPALRDRGWWVVRWRWWWLWRWLAVVLVGALFLWGYRLPPPFFPFPLRWLLPTIDGLLIALLALRCGPHLVSRLGRRFPPWIALVDLLALAGVGGWVAAVLMAARGHVTLSVPGVEKDFRVYATRATDLAEVFRADGFYNLGYPLLLWLVHPLTGGSVFGAARVVAAASGGLLLLAGYWLARTVLDHCARTSPSAPAPTWSRGGALLALLLLALSPLTVRYALFLGSDMPCAALIALSLAALVAAPHHTRRSSLLLALSGAAAGGAFLMRHPALLLLPWGMVACVVLRLRPLPFLVALLLVSLPQYMVNLVETGHPLYSLQAKNIWLAVYGNTDWGRWGEVPDTIGMGEIILRDPDRFAQNWWYNLRSFIGTGAEDTSEHGRALQLRLLGWPANWLAIIGLLGWMGMVVGSRRGEDHSSALQSSPFPRSPALLLLFVALYVPSLCVAFILPRFFLPLAPIYAVAAAWSVQYGITRLSPPPSEAHALRSLMAVGMVLLVVLWGGFHTGVSSVLSQQPADERAVVQMVRALVPPGQQLLARLPPDVPLAKYSAIAHRVAPWPDAPNERTALLMAQREGISYLLWDDASGPPPLPDPEAARVDGVGSYGLYRIILRPGVAHAPAMPRPHPGAADATSPRGDAPVSGSLRARG